MFYIVYFIINDKNCSVKTKEILFLQGKNYTEIFDTMVKNIWKKHPKAVIHNGLYLKNQNMEQTKIFNTRGEV